MSVYYVIMVGLFALAWRVRHSSSSSQTFFALALPLISIFVGFRYVVGCDWFSYQLHFVSQNPSALVETIPFIDPLYWLTIDLINYIGLPYEVLHVVTAIIFFWGFWAFARQFPNPMAILAFSFPILIFSIPMSATRQALAMGFLLFSFAELMKVNYIRSAFLMLLASQFHASAIVFLSFLPLMIFKSNLRGWLLSTPIFAVGFFMIIGSEAFEIASTRYIEGNNDADGAAYRTFLLFVFGLYYKIFLHNRWAIYLPQSYPLINTASIFLIAAFPASFLSPTIVDRYGYYLFIFAAVIASNIPSLAKRNSDIIFLSAIVGIAVFFIGWLLMSWQIQLCYLPYQSWLLGFP